MEGGRTNRMAPLDLSESRFYRYILKAFLWAVFTYFAALFIAIYKIWFVLLCVFIMSIPIAISGIYSSTVGRIRNMEMFVSQGWIYRLFSGRWLRILFWVLWAPVFSFVMLVQFHTYDGLEWLGLLLVIPAYYIVFRIVKKSARKELRDYLITDWSTKIARRVTPAIMIMLNIVIISQFGDIPQYESLTEAIDSQKAITSEVRGTALVIAISDYLAFYNGAKDFALGSLAALDNKAALIIYAIGGFVLFYNACVILSSFMVPAVEYRRILNPLSNTPDPPPIPRLRIGVATGILTVLTLFIYIPLFATLEYWVRDHFEIVVGPIKELEMIGDRLVKAGTVEKIKEIEIETLQKAQASVAELEQRADRAFDQMERNVEPFLDWYYSLPAEYARIGAMLFSDLEIYIEKQLTHFLTQGKAFNQLEESIWRTVSKNKAIEREHKEKVKELIEKNQVIADTNNVKVVNRISANEAIEGILIKNKINFGTRLTAAGAGAGVATTAITAMVISKSMGKAALKQAAKVMAKVVSTRVVGPLAGGAAGAAAGATIGSFVPIIGNAAGAVIGGVIGGLATGATIDKMILMVEERLNREEFRGALIKSINQARQEFKSQIHGK
ncbi:hypothetical protein GF413_03265 [Candidatus Micrarchaeota archaeon]|nr:hypothetical protein [Candidatus Micrarchaeota archaeon]